MRQPLITEKPQVIKIAPNEPQSDCDRTVGIFIVVIYLRRCGIT